MDKDWTDFYIAVMKYCMKPGFLYGLSNDGEIYCVEATMPKPGERVILPPLYMPPEED